MKNIKELYREFELSRLIHMSETAPSTADTTPEVKSTSETPKATKEAADEANNEVTEAGDKTTKIAIKTLKEAGINNNENSDNKKKAEETAKKDPEEMEEDLKEAAGPLGQIKEIITLIATLKTMKGDELVMTIEDLLSDFQNKKNPVEEMEKAKNGYTEKIGKMDKTDELITIIKDPTSKEVTALLKGEGEEKPRYRIKAKEAAVDKLQKELNITLTEGDNALQNTANGVRLSVTSRGVPCTVELEKTESGYNIYRQQLDNSGNAVGQVQSISSGGSLNDIKTDYNQLASRPVQTEPKKEELKKEEKK